MGWEAIEQYRAAVEKEISTPIDQQVPQMPVDYLEAMQIDPDQFYADDTDLKKMTITPAVGETSYRPEENPDICDLDRTSESTAQHVRVLSVQNHVSGQDHVTLQNYEPLTMDSVINYEYNQRRYHAQDQFLTKALSACLQDVEDTCRCLGIARDPLFWSCEDARQWIVWQCRQFNVPEPNMDDFFISGAELCTFTEEDFRTYAQAAGPTLYAQLEILRSVVEQTTCHIYPETQPALSVLPVPVSPTSTVSSGSVSPSPSSYSDSDCQPEAPTTHSPISDDIDRLPEEPVHHHRQTIQLWQFLKLLLLDGNYTDCIHWVDRSRGIFKIGNSSRVAKLWGKRKNRPQMNYDKLSRSIRQYYKKNIIKKTEHSKRLVYQFCKM